MKKLVKRCGGSLCIIISKEERKVYNIDEGDILELKITNITKKEGR